MQRIARLAVGVAATGLVAVFGLAGTAAAHVTVDPAGAAQGGYARVAFRVPNESDTSATVRVEVRLPEATPIASVATRPVPGWSVEVRRTTLPKPVDTGHGQLTEAVTAIVWSAPADAGIRPGQFQEFPVSLGPLPKTDRLVFKTLQTYSDGTVSRWIEEPTDGAESENPAPVLTLTRGGASPVAAGGSSDDGDGLPVGLAVGGLVAGVAGLVLGGVAFARTRRDARR